MRNPNSFALRIDDLASLFEARRWEELISAARQLLDRMGLDGFMMKMRIASGIDRSYIHVLSTLPASLHHGFQNSDGDDFDPICIHISRQSIPLTWDVDDLCSRTATQPYRELKNLGIRTGWSVAARGDHSVSRVDIYSRLPRIAQVCSHSDLLLFSCYLNDAAQALWLHDNPETKAPVLTEREKQCLRWSASGKTSNEIGKILGISQNTVYFHLKNAASKFDVYSTRHAISRATKLNLI